MSMHNMVCTCVTPHSARYRTNGFKLKSHCFIISFLFWSFNPLYFLFIDFVYYTQMDLNWFSIYQLVVNKKQRAWRNIGDLMTDMVGGSVPFYHTLSICDFPKYLPLLWSFVIFRVDIVNLIGYLIQTFNTFQKQILTGDVGYCRPSLFITA